MMIGLRIIVGLFALAAAATFFWLVIVRIAIRIRGVEPCPYSLARLLDTPIRRLYMAAIVERIGIRPGERVLELGPGPGLFTVQAAQRAGPEGTLYAVDIQSEMIAAVEERVRAAEITNVETYVASAYEIPLADATIDRVFLIAVLPEIPDRRRALAEIRRVLVPGGVLSLSEEIIDPDYPLRRTTIRWAEAAGFELLEQHGNWLAYTMNFRTAR